MKPGHVIPLTFFPLSIALSLMGVVVLVVVDGQLYTVLEDVAKVHELTLFNAKDGKLEDHNSTRVTCLARFQQGWNGTEYKTDNVIEAFALYRDFHDSNQLHYFCSNVPKFGEEPESNYSNHMDRLQSPYALFWLKEPTAITWQRRYPSGKAGRDKGEVWQAAKGQGLIFKVEVTGIKSRGRFLKGWYHLKVTLDIDQNYNVHTSRYEYAAPNSTQFEDQKKMFVIDKLMVTARGRILIPTRNRTRGGVIYRRPPRRAWVGGIGEFVKDFPKCKEVDFNNNHVMQQFMPCGTVQYTESMYGNNFYYTRTDNSKYGQPFDNAGGSKIGTEIHINFRLDNSFCNRYYDLDFVANGIAIRGQKQYKTEEWKRAKPSVKDLKDIHPVLRSISTRFIFASSYAHHGPTFYENADPIPRGVNSVSCSESLAAEWNMNHIPDPPPTPTRTKHRMSITTGADLVVSKSRPDSTFGGAIKFMFTVLPDLNTKYHDESDKRGMPVVEESNKFASRRTWTAVDKLFRYPHDVDSNGIDTNPWIAWRDYKNYPDQPLPARKTTDDDKYFEEKNMILGIQRVLNEFDWETWVEETNVAERCDVDKKGELDYPHPYYDITCGGLDVKFKETLRWHHAYVPEPRKHVYVTDPTEFQKTLPPITGRCMTNHWFIDGVGRLTTPTPRCDEFFYDSSTKDPALMKIKETVNTQRNEFLSNDPRSTWIERYGQEVIKKRATVACEIQDKLRTEYSQCPSIPPRPYTQRPRNSSDPLELQLKAAFKLTKAYKRGMLVSESPYTLVIWDARLIHACFMTVMVMFVTPVSFFLTRYFKETFMNARMMLLHVWYIIHIFAAVFTALLYMLGLWRLFESRSLLGVSLTITAEAHRYMGWATVTFAFFLILFGGLRCMNVKVRAVAVIVHAVSGFLFYLLCLLCMMTSIGIPGSPGAYYDHSLLDFGSKLYAEAVFLIIMFWVLFEIGMHVAMTIVQRRKDKEMHLSEARVYLLSPMPVIPETYRFDTPGRFFRINMLRAYIFVSSVATIAICICMITNSPRGRGFGFMSCTHIGIDNDVREFATIEPC